MVKPSREMKDWVTGESPTRVIEDVVRAFAKEYEWHFADNQAHGSLPKNLSPDQRVRQGINSGLCTQFAEEVEHRIPRAVSIYDEGTDHMYLRIDGRYYDAENPHGTSSPERMIYYGRRGFHRERSMWK